MKRRRRRGGGTAGLVNSDSLACRRRTRYSRHGTRGHRGSAEAQVANVTVRRSPAEVSDSEHQSPGLADSEQQARGWAGTSIDIRIECSADAYLCGLFRGRRGQQLYSVYLRTVAVYICGLL